jgi:hypothetical protein
MAGRAEQEESALLYLPTTTILLARAPAFAMDAICELHLLAKALKHAEIRLSP